MAKTKNSIPVYIEAGTSKTLAAALDWPGWCRGARDEAKALQALYDTGTRYALVIEGTSLSFRAPSTVSDFEVIERVAGTQTTDFGAPDIKLASDSEPADTAEVERWRVALQACWAAFDAAMAAAAGKTLAKGPRGGGRDLDKIAAHVWDVEGVYLSSLGGKFKPAADKPEVVAALRRQVILASVTAAVNGEIPAIGPRGGVRWPARYFVRRLAWHVLDHVWEIEDRAAG